MKRILIATTAMAFCLTSLGADKTATEKLIDAQQHHLTRLKACDITTTCEWQEYEVGKVGGKTAGAGHPYESKPTAMVPDHTKILLGVVA